MYRLIRGVRAAPNGESGEVTMDKSGANKAAMNVINVDRAVPISSPGLHALEKSALISRSIS